MLALALALIAPCALGQVQGQYSLSARAAARGRTAAAADAELTPSAALGLAMGRWAGFLEYAPSLHWPLVAGQGPRLLHQGSAAVEWKPQSLTRFLLAQRLRYGESESWPAPTAGPSPIQPGQATVDPNPLGLRTLEAAATLGLDHTLSRRSRLAISVGYLLGGSLEEAQRALAPLRHGPELRSGFHHQASPIDTLESTLWASHVKFSNGSSASLLELQERWRRRLSPQSEAGFSLGGAAIRDEPAQGSPRVSAVPVGLASLTHREASRSGRLELSASAGATPFLDRFAATSYLRAEALAGVNWVHQERLSLGARGGAAIALTGASPGQLNAVLDLVAGYALQKGAPTGWRLEAFLQGSWNGPFQGQAGVALSFREHGPF